MFNSRKVLIDSGVNSGQWQITYFWLVDNYDIL